MVDSAKLFSVSCAIRDRAVAYYCDVVGIFWFFKGTLLRCVGRSAIAGIDYARHDSRTMSRNLVSMELYTSSGAPSALVCLHYAPLRLVRRAV